MCRLLSFKSNNCRRILEVLHELTRISRYDPLLPGKNVGGHENGWGLCIYDHVLKGMVYYKSGNPLHTQPRIAERIIHSLVCPCTGIIHIRRASKGEPLGVNSAHPFIGEVDGAIIALAHNGGIDKYSLAKELGLDGNLNNVSDTYMYFKLLLREYDRCHDIVNALRSTTTLLLTKNLVKSTINSVVLYVYEGDVKVYVVEDWEHFKDDKREYYRIDYAVKEDIVVAASSTLHRLLLSKGYSVYKPKIISRIEYGEHVIKISTLD